MKMSMLRPYLLKSMNTLVCFLRGKGSLIELGKRVRIGRGCEVKIDKNASVKFADDVKLRSGCILQITKGAQLELSDRVELRNYAIIECGGKVRIGKRSVIGAYNWLQGSGEIEIGDDVIIGPGVRIISTTHDVRDPDLVFGAQPLINKSVHIGSNVWIGANVIILAGVTIGSDVVIGAGALVTRDLEGGGVYVGQPARYLKAVR